MVNGVSLVELTNRKGCWELTGVTPPRSKKREIPVIGWETDLAKAVGDKVEIKVRDVAALRC